MKKQPELQLPKSMLARLLDIVTIIIFLTAILYLIVHFPNLPDQVPGHYDQNGVVDRWGNKLEMLILPLVGIALWILMTVLEKYPHTFNYINLREDNIEEQYRNAMLMMNVLKNESVLLFSLLIYQGIQVATGEAQGLGNLFMPIFLIVIFGSMIIFIIKMLRA